MKKTYETPSVEIVEFKYRDQVVVASAISGSCTEHYVGAVDRNCTSTGWTGNNA